MWLPLQDLLADPALNPGSLFVSQAWHELTNPRSPDTYRARTLDSILLLDELQRVLQLAKRDQKWLSHVHAICEEIGAEAVGFQKLGLPSAAKQAFATLGDFRTVKYDDLCRVEETVSIAKALSRDYVPILIAQARACLADGVHEKQGLLRALACLATHAQTLGFADEIADGVDRCDLTQPPEAVVEVISQRFAAPERVYRCFVAIEGPISDLDALFSATDLTRIGLPRIERTAKGAAWHESQLGKYLVEVGCRARSRRLAAESALSRLRAILDLLTLYENAHSHNLSSRVLIEDEAGTLEVVDVSPASHFGLFPRSQYVNTARMRLVSLGSRLDGQVADILGAHALGISASDPRAAIIHFWTALEAIVGGYGSGSIGERVATAVSPIVTGRRIHKIVTYLALGLYDLLKIERTRLDATLMPASTKGRVAREDVLSSLAGPQDNRGVLSLLALSEKSPLLRYHLLRAWQELSDPRALQKSLKQSEQRVRWQLLRIYRARNVFVHMGGQDELMWRLLENAQSYVSFVVGRLMFDLDSNAKWTVRTSLEYQRQHSERVGESLVRDSGALKVSDFLPHLSRGAEDVPLWGAGARFARA